MTLISASLLLSPPKSLVDFILLLCEAVDPHPQYTEEGQKQLMKELTQLGWEPHFLPPAPAYSALDSVLLQGVMLGANTGLCGHCKRERSQKALHSLKSEFTGRVRELFYLLPLWTPGMESISISLKHHLFQFNRKLLFNEIQDW